MAIQGDIQQPVLQIQASRRRRPPWRIAALIVAILVLLLVSDWWQANRELDHLLTAVESSEKSMNQGIAAVVTVLQTYGSPTDSEQNQNLFSHGRSACSSAAANVQETGVMVSDVQMLPWHPSLNQAKSRYLAHNAVWLRLFRECAVDPVKWGDQATKSEIEATFRVAHRSFQGAVPFLPLNRGPERIAAIFKE